MVSTLRDIEILGANWVATHPYAGISQDGSVRIRRFEGASDLAPAHWTRPIVEAHKRGLKICIKPHLAYWRSGFEWRGEIAFRSEEEWTRFWTDYRAWILAVAEACKDADAFVIGTELDKTLNHEAEWRALIADVRKVYKGQDHLRGELVGLHARAILGCPGCDRYSGLFSDSKKSTPHRDRPPQRMGSSGKRIASLCQKNGSQHRIYRIGIQPIL